MKHLIILIALLTFSHLQMSAQSKDEIIVADMHAFGYATSLNDSVVYLTEISPIPVANVDRKTGFLSKRAVYSGQLKEYMAKQGVEHATCAIIFDRNKVKLNKKFVKLMNKLQKKKMYLIKTISTAEFTFKDPMTGL